MKRLKIKQITGILIVFVSLCVIFTSCKREEIDSESGTPKLVFTVSGVDKPDDFNSYGKMASISPNKGINQNSDYNELKLSNKVSFGSYAEENIIPTGFDNINSSSKIEKKLAATSPMETDVLYRILLYSANNPTAGPEKTIIAKAGQSVEIDVVKGGQYNWYAYSYNTKNASDLPLPADLQNPIIETPTNSDLLYASGTITATARNTPLPITFKHKVAQLVLEFDTDRVFGQLTDFEGEFEDDYLSKGDFNIKTGQTTITSRYKEPITEASFSEIHPTKRNVKVARYYVADQTPLASYKVKISKMDVEYLNGTPAQLIASGGPTRTTTFTFPGGAKLGKQHIGVFKLWYLFPVRTVLHVTRTDTEIYGYAAQPYMRPNGTLDPSNNKAAFNMLTEPRNYGQLSNSVVRSGGFVHIRCRENGTLHTFLANKPDITIISVYYEMSAADRTALINYINEGGVVLLMTDGVNDPDRNAQQPFFRDLFNTQTITLQNNGYNGGALYKMSNINDEILNGPFGDIRGKYWGEDASPTTSLANVPLSEITFYSEAKAANGSAPANGVTMFKHKRKHFFWIGDGGFLSNERSRGNFLSVTVEPFVTVDLSQPPATAGNTNPQFNYNNYPIPKPSYGYAGQGFSSGGTMVYNSTVFANVMSWGIVNAEFFGINTGGIGNAYVNVP